MSIDNISVSLRVWRPDGDDASATALLDKLEIGPGDPVTRLDGQGAARVQLLALSIGDFLRNDEPSEAFAAAVKAGLLAAGEWLARQSPDVFATLRETGFDVDVFIGAWIDSDQIDLDVPPEFSRGCGRHGLTMSLVTND